MASSNAPLEVMHPRIVNTGARLVLRQHNQDLGMWRAIQLWLVQRPHLRSLPWPWPASETLDQYTDQYVTLERASQAFAEPFSFAQPVTQATFDELLYLS